MKHCLGLTSVISATSVIIGIGIGSTLWAAGVADAKSAAAVKAPDDLSGPWQLLIDDYLVASKKGLVRTYHHFEKYSGNPIMIDDQPWEGSIMSVCKVMPSDDGKSYRMWYYCWSRKDDPAKRHHCYAVSKDGLHWEKPNLGIRPWNVTGTKDTNIIDISFSITPMPWETDPAMRFKSFSGGTGGYHVSASPDGLRDWKRLSSKAIIHGGDVGLFYWDTFTNQYRASVKVGADVSGLRRRSVGGSYTKDVLKWPALRLIMAPDDIDDRWATPDSTQRTHFYGCPMFNYQTMYLGALWVFRANDKEGYFNGPAFPELVSSRDGWHWLREEGDRPPMLELGPQGSWDDGMVWGGPPVLKGNELWLYYTGFDGPHDTMPIHSGIGLAKMRKDGYVSLDAAETLGEIVTKRLTSTAGKLHVNLNTVDGWVRVEVLDADGKVLPGYRQDQCDTLTGDYVDKIVTWGGKADLPKNVDGLRLRFILKKASLYSFEIGEAVKVIDEPAGPVMEALYTFEGITRDCMQDQLRMDGAQEMRLHGTIRIGSEEDKVKAAFGKQCVKIGNAFRPHNRLELMNTPQLGTHFTLAGFIKSDDNKHARLFSAYNGNKPCNTSELIFDFDPTGKIVDKLRLVCKGIPVYSDPVKFDDKEYHHLAVVYDDGEVHFYLDGKDVGTAWLPGGMPVNLARNLLVGGDENMGGMDVQFNGFMDDIVVLARSLKAEDIATMAKEGAAVFFEKTGRRLQRS